MTDKTWVYVGGTFDLPHWGHFRFLQQCREYGPVLVSLNTDKFAAKYKRKPIMELDERYKMLAGCKYVDDLCINAGGARIKYIAHGDDWTGESLMKQMGLATKWMDERGIKLLYIPYTRGISTSEIIARVKDDIHGSADGTRGLRHATTRIEGVHQTDSPS